MPSPHQPPLIDVEHTPVIISASRRTDLAACYPEYLIEKLRDYPPARVHTVIIWSKNPHHMLTHPALRSTLGHYRQIYIHLTITGLGGSVLEPCIPAWQEVAAMVPELIELTGDARRISWRFDPIIRVDISGTILSNVDMFSAIIPSFSAAGIVVCRTSWVEPYTKVQRRLSKRGITLLPYTDKERLKQANALTRTAEKHGLRMQFCAVPGLPRSRCIDGELLSELHPDGLQCSRLRAKGQRPLCGCTHSIDIGWYSQKCPNGCLYCYAEPLIQDVEKRSLVPL